MVIGRAEYLTHGNAYHVRYKSVHGTAAEGWWDESALEAAQ
jgi:hypothetical protein